MPKLFTVRDKATNELENATEKLERAKETTAEFKDELIEAKTRVAEAVKERTAAETRLAEAKAYFESVDKLAATAEKHRNETLNAVKAMEQVCNAQKKKLAYPKSHS